MNPSVTFLGTGGGRIVVLNQLRHSGGMWLELDGTNILVDPGPGCLVRTHQHKLKPGNLKAIILSHRHIDHSNDVNVMIEAMTNGGFKPRGQLILPDDCINEDPVVLQYIRHVVDIKTIKEGLSMEVENIKIRFPVKNRHPVETYSMIFEFSAGILGYIPDTDYFPELSSKFTGIDVLIINVVRMKRDSRIQHLSMADAESIINDIVPRQAILTHFGVQVLKAGPEREAKRISRNTGIPTIAAWDGLKFEFDHMEENIFEKFVNRS